MKDKTKSLYVNNIHIIRAFIFITIAAFCVLIGGLFFSSQTVKNDAQPGKSSAVHEGFYFTPPQIPDKLILPGNLYRLIILIPVKRLTGNY